MSKYFPDCPVGMRITDMESKQDGGFTLQSTNPNHHHWTLREKRILVQMRDEGKTFREIAEAIGERDVTMNSCMAAYHNMEDRGEVGMYEEG